MRILQLGLFTGAVLATIVSAATALADDPPGFSQGNPIASHIEHGSAPGPVSRDPEHPGPSPSFPNPEDRPVPRPVLDPGRVSPHPGYGPGPGTVIGAPAPIIGAGLPVLAVGGIGYWAYRLFRRRRDRA
jgi:hypothetical protein